MTSPLPLEIRNIETQQVKFEQEKGEKMKGKQNEKKRSGKDSRLNQLEIKKEILHSGFALTSSVTCIGIRTNPFLDCLNQSGVLSQAGLSRLVYIKKKVFWP